MDRSALLKLGHVKLGHVFASSSDWFIGLSPSVVIVRVINFGFDFPPINQSNFIHVSENFLGLNFLVFS